MSSNLTEKFQILTNCSNGKTTADEPIDMNVSLNLDHYLIKGAAGIKAWGGNEIGSIIMRPFEIDASGIQSEEEFMAIVASLLNDNGFGCEYIKGAYVEIWAVYEGFDTEAKKFAKDAFVNKPGYELTDKEKSFLEEAFLYSN